jgi:hypothetical protein
MPPIESDLNPFAPPPTGDDASGADGTSEFASQQVWETLPSIQFGSAMAIAGGIGFLAFVVVCTVVDMVTMDQWHFESLLEGWRRSQAVQFFCCRGTGCCDGTFRFARQFAPVAPAILPWLSKRKSRFGRHAP